MVSLAWVGSVARISSQPELDFDRLVDARCLFCHSDRPEFTGAEGHRFSGAQLAAISCDRCHGPGEEHARHPSAGNIVNPVKLPPAARDSICEQCHLEGETRMLNPGKRWLDFRPGEPFEQVAATYIGARQGATTHAVSQSEQLARSKCLPASGGRLWCATCHNPHRQKTDAAEVRRVCISCHATLSKAAHPSSTSECVSCHMPRLTPDDIPHAANTDHSIPRRPQPRSKSATPLRIRWFPGASRRWGFAIAILLWLRLWWAAGISRRLSAGAVREGSKSYRWLLTRRMPGC